MVGEPYIAYYVVPNISARHRRTLRPFTAMLAMPPFNKPTIKNPEFEIIRAFSLLLHEHLKGFL